MGHKEFAVMQIKGLNGPCLSQKRVSSYQLFELYWSLHVSS